MIPENRDFVHRRLRELVLDLEKQKEALNKDSESRLKVLDYLSKKKTPHQHVISSDTDTQLDLLTQDTDRTYKII